MPDLVTESIEEASDEFSEEKRQRKWTVPVICISLVLLTLGSRICIAYYLATDAPADGLAYAQIARNILEHNVYSTDTEEPFNSTYVRLPGYPLFLAAVYSVFGHENNTAVRIVQAVFDTATCVIIAILALLWTTNEARRRRSAFWAFVLSALCPFVVIYTATILTETLATFLMAAMALTATLAFKSAGVRKTFLWWGITGLLAGIAVLLRPDSGLFAAGIGSTLVISGLFFTNEDSPKFSLRSIRVLLQGTVFTTFFILALTPWTVRNYRVFGIFQPIAPSHAEMPGEFVPYGYQRWLRTWIDDSRFIEPMLWNLDERPIELSVIPRNDFDSADERDRVAALLQQYDHPPGSEEQNASASKDEEDTSADQSDSGDDESDNSADNSDSSDDSEAGDNSEANQTDSGDDVSDDAENKKFVVKMTPEIDAQFAQIAQERIDRAPFRFFLFLPAKRAAAMWFDSHSLYYPFGGQMSPISDLDYDEYQQYWLPAFTMLTWVYTLLAIGGILALWRQRADRTMLRWLLLLALMTLPRLMFFSTIENPEQRYVIELFAFTALLGAFWLCRPRLKTFESGDEGLTEPQPRYQRLLSLDVFRGMTIAAMTLVNLPGSWQAIYPPLLHAEWNGATPTDWIFPFFLFIVGVSITFSLGRAVDGGSVGRLYLKIFKRAGLLFAIGIVLEIFPFYNIWTATWFEPNTMRIMGVLQRIALCYLAASLIFLHTNWKKQAAITAAILLAYWALMILIKVPGCEVTSISDHVCNLASYVDRTVLGEAHIWERSKAIDPEGLLTTLPAIATTLIGVLAGQWLRSEQEPLRKIVKLLGAGIVFWIIGLAWSFWFPLNKSLWTSSYVVYTAGLAMVLLATLYWLVDLKGYKRWSTPFLIFGTNAIALYVGSTLVAAGLSIAEVDAPNDKTFSLQEAIFKGIFLAHASPINASLLYAISFVLIWLFLIWLLYRKGIYIKL